MTLHCKYLQCNYKLFQVFFDEYSEKSMEIQDSTTLKPVLLQLKLVIYVDSYKFSLILKKLHWNLSDNNFETWKSLVIYQNQLWNSSKLFDVGFHTEWFWNVKSWFSFNYLGLHLVFCLFRIPFFQLQSGFWDVNNLVVISKC